MYSKFVSKVSNIDTSGFVLKTNNDTDKPDLQKKVPDTGGLVEKTDYNYKIIEIEGKIPSIKGLASNAALTTVEDKIPAVNNLIRKNKK